MAELRFELSPVMTVREFQKFYGIENEVAVQEQHEARGGTTQERAEPDKSNNEEEKQHQKQQHLYKKQ